MNPQDYNLPHDKFRKGQGEAIEFLFNASSHKFKFLNAPTGSGKSAIAAALGSQGNTVRVITHTNALQEQYLNYPGFETVFGMARYPCELLWVGNADSCAHADKMDACSKARICQYLIARKRTKEAQRQVLSFAYYGLSTWPKTLETDTLFIDEAHFMPQFIMSMGTLNYDAAYLSRYNFEQLPMPSSVKSINVAKIKLWIRRVIEQAGMLKKVFKDKSEFGHMRQMSEIANKLELILVVLHTSPDSLYISLVPGEITIIPLDPRPFANMVLSYDTMERIVFASATLGNNKTFAKLLDIPKYVSHTVSPQFGAINTPIRWYKNAPAINYGNKRQAMVKQAEIIEKIINEEMTPLQHTLIHTASIEDSLYLAELLEKTFPGRVYTPSKKVRGTDAKVAEWKKTMQEKPGLIAVSAIFGTGVDAPEVTTNILQKVPFGLLDDYGRQLVEKNPQLYRWQTANAVEQACGRTRRGLKEHYDFNGNAAKIVAIIDNNFKRVKRATSPFFQQCLVNV